MKKVMALVLGVLVSGMPLAAAGQEPEAPFDVVLLSMKSDWQAVRYHKASGESWYALAGQWKPIPEPDGMKPPAGAYKVTAGNYGENDWIALRLDTKSGRSWRLGALKWIEMKVVEEDKKPPAAAPATGSNAK